MRMSPPSGLKKPAARLSKVVLPHPDGPSSVMNSPRRIDSETSRSATASPKRFVTESKRTAMSSPAANPVVCAATPVSASMFNIQYLTETQECVGEDDQRTRADDLHHRQPRHRRIAISPHIVLQGKRKGLRPLR